MPYAVFFGVYALFCTIAAALKAEESKKGEFWTWFYWAAFLWLVFAICVDLCDGRFLS